MDAKNAKNHVTLVAGLHIGLGALTMISGALIYFGMHFAWGFIPDDEEIPRELLSAIFSFIPAIVLFFGVIDLLAGIALFSYKQWSRVFMIIVSAINCFNIPIGTAKGIYSIWALMQPDVLELFE